MNKKLNLLFVLCNILLISAIRADYQLVWSDEFDGDELDLTKWDIEVNCWGGGNLEKQCYTPRKDNINIKDGILQLIAKKETYMGKFEGCTNNFEDSCTWTQPTTSGRIRTMRSFHGSFIYGKFEAKMKLPKGNFLWPAFWMLPTETYYGPWATSGEIDIMEFRGQKTNIVINTIHHSDVWPNNKYTSSDEVDMGFDATENFHVYSVEWSPKSIVWSVDEKKTFEVSLEQKFSENYDHNGAPFDRPFHILFDLAVGGGFFDPSIYGVFDAEVDTQTWANPVFEIDYVRVYQDPSQVLPECQSCSSNQAPSSAENLMYPTKYIYVQSPIWNENQYAAKKYNAVKFNLHSMQEPWKFMFMFDTNAFENLILDLYQVSDDFWESQNMDQFENQASSIYLSSFNVHANRRQTHKLDVTRYIMDALQGHNNHISFAIVVPENANVNMQHLYASANQGPRIEMSMN